MPKLSRIEIDFKQSMFQAKTREERLTKNGTKKDVGGVGKVRIGIGS
jgi:hypothetical protein